MKFDIPYDDVKYLFEDLSDIFEDSPTEVISSIALDEVPLPLPLRSVSLELYHNRDNFSLTAIVQSFYNGSVFAGIPRRMREAFGERWVDFGGRNGVGYLLSNDMKSSYAVISDGLGSKFRKISIGGSATSKVQFPSCSEALSNHLIRLNSIVGIVTNSCYEPNMDTRGQKVELPNFFKDRTLTFRYA